MGNKTSKHIENIITTKELPGWRAIYDGKRYGIYNSANHFLATYHLCQNQVCIRYNHFKDRGSDIGAGCYSNFASINQAMKWVYLKTQKPK